MIFWKIRGGVRAELAFSWFLYIGPVFSPLLIFIEQPLILFVCSVSLVGHPGLAITGPNFRYGVQTPRPEVLLF